LCRSVCCIDAQCGECGAQLRAERARQELPDAAALPTNDAAPELLVLDHLLEDACGGVNSAGGGRMTDHGRLKQSVIGPFYRVSDASAEAIAFLANAARVLGQELL